MWYQIVAILAFFAGFWAFNHTRWNDGFMSYFASFKDQVVKMDQTATSKLVSGCMTIMFGQLAIMVTALAINWVIFAVLAMVWALFYWIRLLVAYHLQVSDAC